MKKPFAVGDRVRVYTVLSSGKEICGVGTITDVSTNVVRVMPLGSYADGWVHVKQCRRLVKRKPAREWFIELDIAGEVVDVAATKDDLDVYAANTVIRVREVRPKK